MPIWKETVPVGEPEVPSIVAEKPAVDEGQKKPELRGQIGSSPASGDELEGDGKKSPLNRCL